MNATLNRHHVVVVGAGFGGLETVRALAGAPVRITMVDRRNHHLFQPLLYQVDRLTGAVGDRLAYPASFAQAPRGDDRARLRRGR